MTQTDQHNHEGRPRQEAPFVVYRCSHCGRVLTHPRSIRLEAGPVCARREQVAA